MKLIPIFGALLMFAGGILATQEQGDRIVVLSGDTQGYLSPCGCSSPMMGGIRRRASVIRSLAKQGQTTILENGGLVEGGGRQDQMKAETLTQTMADVGVTAINVGPSDAKLGPGGFQSITQLSGSRTVSLNISDPEAHYLGGSTIRDGPFLIGGATDQPLALAGPIGVNPVRLDDAVKQLVDEAKETGLKPILMLQGSHESAVRLARSFPEIALIQYSSVGDPPVAIEMVGNTALATTGEHGKHLVRLSYHAGQFQGYRSITLSPEIGDDPAASRFYAAYLRRVTGEKLLDKLPRSKTAAFAGSWTCGSCHGSATHTWKGSAHRIAYSTLQSLGHGRDPDCVSCHVVGLSSTKGFVSLAQTPQFAGVGCESCHGPARDHVLRPKLNPLRRIDEKSCAGCHNPQNSPNFDFPSYWAKIKHR